MQISYILAGYNEEAIIATSIERCLASLKTAFDDYELILIDDGSLDDTGKIMDQFAENNSKIKVLHNLVNLNFGTSILRGMMIAQKEWVIYNAVDLPLLPEETKNVLKAAQGYDVLVLDRISYDCVLWRSITSKVNSLLLKVLFPILKQGLPTTNYIQVFRNDRIKNCIPISRSPIFVPPEMIFRAKLSGLRVGNYKHSPHIDQTRKGAFGKPHDIIWGIYEMLRFRFRLWRHKI